MSRYSTAKRVLMALILAWTLAPGAWAAGTVDFSLPIPFDIPAQSLSSALVQFADQAGVQLTAPGTSLAGYRSAGVHGKYSRNTALTMILQGTGLTYRLVGGGTVAISGPTADAPARSSAAPEGAKEGKTSSSGQFRLAQPGAAEPAGPDVVAQSGPHEPVLQEVVVTGSRLLQMGKQGVQDVKVYSRVQIDQSGQTSIADFLNTVPAVSVNANEAGVSTQSGGTAVQLHGLPIGTTLVLINGHRVEPSAVQAGSGFDFFDLNNIPLAAVERVEVLSEGASAVYGADAIAGVVNVILRNNIDGFEADVKSGWARGLQETDTSFAWGRSWERGAVSFIGSFQDRGELSGADRSVGADQDYTRFGGPDAREPICPLANIYSTDGSNLPGTHAPYAAVNPGSAPGHYSATPGALNLCSLSAYADIIPETRRWGGLLQAHYDLTDSTTAFLEVLYSHVQESPNVGLYPLFGQPGFQQFTVAASNPYNPYGETVGMSQLLTGVGDVGLLTDTQYVRPLVGLRGKLFGAWSWEMTGSWSSDRTRFTESNFLDPVAAQAALNSSDPVTALDPFSAGPPASPQVLQSLLDNYRVNYQGQTSGASGFIRGPLLTLPSGTVDAVIGSELGRDEFTSENINDPFGNPGTQSFSRTRSAAFGEVRVPLIANRANPAAGDRLAVSIAGRYDHYNDFGGKATPQFGVEFRPLESLLLRASYGRAFKAPTLPDLHNPQITNVQFLSDPLLNNNLESVTILGGGNPSLHPETGSSRTLGLVYSNPAHPALTLSITNWKIIDKENIQIVNSQVVVDNPGLFPGRITRAASCAPGPPCPIVQVDDFFANFGEIDAEGFDYDFHYGFGSRIGRWDASLSAVQTYHYEAGLTPGVAPMDTVSKAQDSGAWAPRWKAAAGLGWDLGSLGAHIDGRYVGRYQDYDSTNVIGNFWLFDASVRYGVGKSLARDNHWLRGTYAELGAINLFDRSPQFSNFGFDTFGYDPAEADIRGRYLYVKLGVQF